LRLARLAAPAPPAPRLLDRGGIARARRWARRREGAVAFAVKAPGRPIRGLRAGRQFPSASVVKAMLALAVVREARHRDLTASERALLTPMIRESDNDAADDVYFGLVGGVGLQRVARAAHMRRFTEVGYWANELITAADQARLFVRIDRLAPRRHRRFLRRLLASIVPWQRWGIAPLAERRGFHVMFKGGWRIGIGHQVALLERDGRRVALAVLTSGTGDPYARATEAGIARRLLAKR
jgi:beta-lactamase family protein